MSEALKVSATSTTSVVGHLILFSIAITAFLVIEDRVWNLQTEVITKSDTYTYANVARRILRNCRLFHKKRPPGFPLLLVVLNGSSEPSSPAEIVDGTAPRVVQLQRWLQLSTLLVLGSLLFVMTRTALFSCLVLVLMTLQYGLHLYVHTALTEGLSNIFLVLILALVALYMRKPNRITFIMLIIASTYWVWLRPNHWMLFLIMLAVWSIHRTISWKNAAVLFAVVSCLPLYYSFRNYQARDVFTYSVGSSQTYVWHVAYHRDWYEKIPNKSPQLTNALDNITADWSGELPLRHQIVVGPVMQEGLPWSSVMSLYRNAVLSNAPATIYYNYRELAQKLLQFFKYEHRLDSDRTRITKGRAWLLWFNSYIRLIAGFCAVAGIFSIGRRPHQTASAQTRRVLMHTIGWLVLVFWIFHSFFLPTHSNNSRFIYAILSALFLGAGLFLADTYDAFRKWLRPRTL